MTPDGFASAECFSSAPFLFRGVDVDACISLRVVYSRLVQIYGFVEVRHAQRFASTVSFSPHIVVIFFSDFPLGCFLAVAREKRRRISEFSRNNKSASLRA